LSTVRSTPWITRTAPKSLTSCLSCKDAIT
jgi:hypothetical protein